MLLYIDVAPQATRLLLRQPALDTAGLPLLGRLLYARGGGSSSSRHAGPPAEGPKGGHGHLSPVAAAEGRQWLLHLLWLGLRVSAWHCVSNTCVCLCRRATSTCRFPSAGVTRPTTAAHVMHIQFMHVQHTHMAVLPVSHQALVWVLLLPQGPADARMYSRQYVVELLLATTSSPTMEPPSSAAAAARGSAAMSHDLAHTAAAAAAAGGSSSGAAAFDAWVGRLVRQALVLPGAAAHLVAAAGCVPWLGGVAAAAIRATAATTGPWGASTSIQAGTGSSQPWALQCLTSLLRRHICLRQRAQAGSVFGSYLAAAAAATHALLEVCTPGSTTGSGLTPATAWGELPLEVGAAACSTPPALLPHLAALLDLLLAAAQATAAAPAGAAALEQLLTTHTLWRLLCACTAAAGCGGSSTGARPGGVLHPTEARLLQLLQVLGLGGSGPLTSPSPARGPATAGALVGAAHRTAVGLCRWTAKMGGEEERELVKTLQADE
jgi:hypothetical protein